MSETRALTANQIKRLRSIADYQPNDTHLGMPYPAFWPGWNTDRSLVGRGLVERVDVKSGLGTLCCCRLTEAGRAALARAKGAS